VLKISPYDSILIQWNLANTFSLESYNFCHQVLNYFQWFLAFRFPTKTHYAFLMSHACYINLYFTILDFAFLIACVEGYTQRKLQLCSFLQAVTPSRLGPNILLSTVLPLMRGANSHVRVNHQNIHFINTYVSYPYIN